MIYIHPTAEVEKGVKIGKGTKIWHYVQIRKGVEIGKNCNIGKGVYIGVNVKIGANCKVQNYALIYQGVTLGNKVFIGPAVVFTNDLYPRSFIWNKERLIKTKVKEGASIGANATIVCGITIGRYSMIGAGSVVTNDVPDYALVYGAPAKIKGFVCKCGKKITKWKEKREKMEGICEDCKEKIIIDKNLYKICYGE